MVTHGREQSRCSIKRQGKHLWESDFFFKAVEIITSETHYRLTYPVSDAEWLIRCRGGNFTLHVSLLN